MGLPTLPVNRRDPRAKAWSFDFVAELEAYPAQQLRALVEDCIARHIDEYAWANTRQAEALERQTLEKARYFVQEQNRRLGTYSTA
jgi:hypothetical protein